MMAEQDNGNLERQEEDTTAVEEHQTSVEDDSSLARERKLYSIATKLCVLSKYDELGGNKSKTAKECGVSRQCVQDWLEASGLTDTEENEEQDEEAEDMEEVDN